MKKVNFIMALINALILSFSMSLIMNIASGHFSFPSWGLGFIVSFTLSLILAMILPLTKVQLMTCKKIGIRYTDIGALLLNALLSSLFYTPVVAFVMSLLMSSLANMQMTKAINGIEAQIQEMQPAFEQAIAERNTAFDSLNEEKEKAMAEADADEVETSSLDVGVTNERVIAAQRYYDETSKRCDEMSKALSEMKNAQASIENGRPKLLPEFIKCLVITFLAGFIINFTIIPAIFDKVYEKYGTERKVDGVII